MNIKIEHTLLNIVCVLCATLVLGAVMTLLGLPATALLA